MHGLHHVNPLVIIFLYAVFAPLLFWEKVEKQVKMIPDAIPVEHSTISLLAFVVQLDLVFTFLIPFKLLAMVTVQAPRVPLGLAMIVLDTVVFQARN